MADVAQRLERFYKKYNPEKIDEIESVLIKYKGKEEQLFQALIRKYGPEPSVNDDTATTTSPPPPPIDDLFKPRLIAFYKKYNPEKIDEIENVLKKYKGKEPALFDALVRKYGPEPGDEEEDNDDDDEEEEEDKQAVTEPVIYCPIDTLPPEYCEYGPCFDDCKPWLLANCPDLYLQKYNRTVAELDEAEKQIAAGVEGITLKVSGVDKKNKRKLGIKDIKNNPGANNSSPIYIERMQRNKRKYVTLLVGLEKCEGVKLKEAAKKLGKKFACSASVNKLDTGGQQIQLQGDCGSDLPELLVEMFGISEERIFFLEKGKASAAF